MFCRPRFVCLLALVLTSSFARAQGIWPESWDFPDTKSYHGAPGTIRGKNIYEGPTIPPPIKEIDKNCSIPLSKLFTAEGAEFLWDVHSFWFYKGFRKVPTAPGPKPWDQKADWAAGKREIERMSPAERAAKDPTHNPHATHQRVKPTSETEAEVENARRWIAGVHGPSAAGFNAHEPWELLLFPKDPDDTLFRNGISSAVRTDHSGQVIRDGYWTGIQKQALPIGEQSHVSIRLNPSPIGRKIFKVATTKTPWLFPSASGHQAAWLALSVTAGHPVPPPFAWSGTGLGTWASILEGMGVKAVGPVRIKGPRPEDWQEAAEAGIPIMVDVIVMGVGATVGATILSQWIGMLQVRLETGTIDRIQPPDDLRANAGRAPAKPEPVVSVRYVPMENFSAQDKQDLILNPRAPFNPAFGRPISK